MGLGRRKVRGQDKAAARNVKKQQKKNMPAQAPAQSGKKRSEQMSEVLAVTVPGSSLTLIRDNAPFVFEGKLALAAMLYAEDVGGLNRRAAHDDQDKGQFLQQIGNNSVHIHVDEEMLEAEKLLLIPDEITIENVREYAFLAEEEDFDRFIPTIVSWDGANDMSFTEYPDMPKPFSWFCGIQAGEEQACEEAQALFERHAGIADHSMPQPGAGVASSIGRSPVLSEDVSEDDGFIPEDIPGEGYEEGTNAVPASDTVQNGPVSDAATAENSTALADDIPEFVEEETVMEETPQAAVAVCPVCGMPLQGDECPSCGWSAASDEDDDEDEAMDDMDMDMVIQAASHVFYQDDLNLEVTSSMFDTLYADNPFVPLKAAGGEGYVAEYAAHIAENCNAELLALHKRNLFEAKEEFLQMVTIGCQDIANQMSVHNPDSPFAGMLQDIEEAYDKKEAAAAGQIEEKRRNLEERWAKELQSAMDTAAAKAKRDYEERFSRAHDTMLQDVSADVASMIQAEKDEDIKELNLLRREKAQTLLQSVYQNAFVEVTDRYKERLEAEAQLRQNYELELRGFVDKNLEDARKKTDADLKQVAYKRELDEAEATANRRLSEQAARHDADFQRWDRERQEMEARFEQAKKAYEEKIAAMEEQSVRDKDDIRGLITECATTREKVTTDVAKEYEAKLMAASEENRRLENQIQTIHENNRKIGRTNTAMWVAIAAVVGLIGLILGGRVLPQQPNQGYTLRLETDAPADPGTDAAE